MMQSRKRKQTSISSDSVVPKPCVPILVDRQPPTRKISPSTVTSKTSDRNSTKNPARGEKVQDSSPTLPRTGVLLEEPEMDEEKKSKKKAKNNVNHESSSGLTNWERLRRKQALSTTTKQGAPDMEARGRRLENHERGVRSMPELSAVTGSSTKGKTLKSSSKSTDPGIMGKSPKSEKPRRTGETRSDPQGAKSDKKGRRRSRKEAGLDIESVPEVEAPVLHEQSKSHSKRQRANDLNLAVEAARTATKSKGDDNVDQANAGSIVGRVGGGKRKSRGTKETVTDEQKARYVAMDCEMVGVGIDGKRSVLARCCIVGWDGEIIYDKHVVPEERVTDFRTFVSGVRSKDLRGGSSLRSCRDEVAHIMSGKVLVGHALNNDLKVLMLSHPRRMIRDTSTYRPYKKTLGRAGGKLRPKSLKVLALEFLGRSIQEGEHHPAEDARAAMDLYKASRHEWEQSLLLGKKSGLRGVVDQVKH